MPSGCTDDAPSNMKSLWTHIQVDTGILMFIVMPGTDDASSWGYWTCRGVCSCSWELVMHPDIGCGEGESSVTTAASILHTV